MGGIRGLVSGVIKTGGSGTAISCPISGLPLIKYRINRIIGYHFSCI
jgi:hypothetical protein